MAPKPPRAKSSSNKSPNHTKLLKMFEDADEDGDGLLDLNEYTRIHLQLKHIPGLEFEDENGDGQLDLKEFAQTLANLNIPNSPDPRASTEKDSTTIDEEE